MSRVKLVTLSNNVSRRRGLRDEVRHCKTISRSSLAEETKFGFALVVLLCFAGDSGGAIVLKDGRAIGIHQETVIQARERIEHGADLDTEAQLESVEASVNELIQSLSCGSIGLQLSAIPSIV